MQVMMEGRHLWDAVRTGTVERSNDRLVLEAILRGVPSKMAPTLAVKATAKEAWDTVKTMRLGVARVREAKLATLSRQYNDIRFADDETVDDFAMRISNMVAHMVQLGETMAEKRIIRKFLSVIPKRYSQIALSTETLVDLDTLSVEELTGRLKAAQERYELEQTEAGVGHLLLTEEELNARLKNRGGSSSDELDCRKKKREGGNQTNLAQAEAAVDEDPTFLMAQVCMITDNGDIADDYVDLVEEHAEVHHGRTKEEYDSKWYLDTGASNHMSGSATCFNELDQCIAGTVKFGDGSVVAICGAGPCFSPTATKGTACSAVSTSSLVVGDRENGFKTVIAGGVFTLSDRRCQYSREPREPATVSIPTTSGWPGRCA
ncbi:hypothetical protein D1007_33249 [Hordeum vulgare]|nr:hypothetical protein D1007_33249 [Hordeum vulgare]